MPVMISTRLDASEYDPYYEKYISLVADDDIVAILGRQRSETLSFLQSISEEMAETRYAPGKWSIKEVVGHILDFERIFAYRALLISRGEPSPLPGCDQDILMTGAPFDTYRMSDLTTELDLVRQSNISLFEHLSREGWERRGVANGVEVSVKALAYILAGHVEHHLRVIRERYL